MFRLVLGLNEDTNSDQAEQQAKYRSDVSIHFHPQANGPNENTARARLAGEPTEHCQPDRVTLVCLLLPIISGQSRSRPSEWIIRHLATNRP